MKRYVCSVCGFVYDEAEGYTDDGINPETVWANVPADWLCPVCSASKSEFDEE